MPQATKRHGTKKKSAQNVRYINERQHNKSHIRRLIKHLRGNNANDRAAKGALIHHSVQAGITPHQLSK